jgi:hypothetical protein
VIVAIANCKWGTTAVAGGFGAPTFSPQDDGPSAVRISSKLTGKRKVATKAFNFGRQPSRFGSPACGGPGGRDQSPSVLAMMLRWISEVPP